MKKPDSDESGFLLSRKVGMHAHQHGTDQRPRISLAKLSSNKSAAARVTSV